MIREFHIKNAVIQVASNTDYVKVTFEISAGVASMVSSVLTSGVAEVDAS
jgi:O-glycosyl hydrolase